MRRATPAHATDIFGRGGWHIWPGVSACAVDLLGTGRHVDVSPGVPPWEGPSLSVASESPERAGRLTAPGAIRIGHEVEASDPWSTERTRPLPSRARTT